METELYCYVTDSDFCNVVFNDLGDLKNHDDLGKTLWVPIKNIWWIDWSVGGQTTRYIRLPIDSSANASVISQENENSGHTVGKFRFKNIIRRLDFPDQASPATTSVLSILCLVHQICSHSEKAVAANTCEGAEVAC